MRNSIFTMAAEHQCKLKDWSPYYTDVAPDMSPHRCSATPFFFFFFSFCLKKYPDVPWNSHPLIYINSIGKKINAMIYINPVGIRILGIFISSSGQILKFASSDIYQSRCYINPIWKLNSSRKKRGAALCRCGSISGAASAYCGL